MIGYLAGPIAGCNDAEANDWREFVKDHVTNVKWLDPMDRDFRHYGGRTKEVQDVTDGLVNGTVQYESLPDEIVELIVHGDKECIDESDVILYNCWKPGWGTAMEMIYAWEQGKYNLVVATGHVSPWIRYHSDDVVETLEEAVDRLNALVL